MANWDRFKYYTRGRIMEELKEEGIPITRYMFERLYDEGYFPAERMVGRWKRWTPLDARTIKRVIKGYFKIDIEDDY